MGLGKKVFTRRNGFQKGGRLYKWSPIPTDKKINDSVGNRQFFCTATPRSQGEDWIVTYVYELVVINGQQHRYAYVACNYVE